MSSQLPESFINFKGLRHVQNVNLNTSKLTINNLGTLIFTVILLVLLLSIVYRDKTLSQLVLASGKKGKAKRKITRATFFLPVSIPVLDSIYTLTKFRRDGVQLIESWINQFGNLCEVPFGPVTLTLTSDPIIIQKLLSSNQLAHLNRSPIYKIVFGDIFHNGLLTSENEIWSAQRKMLNRCFTYKSLQNYAVFMNRHAANLTSALIDECENKGETYEIGVQRINQLLYCHSFKIIAQIVMGTDSLSFDESNEVAETFNCGKDLIADRLLNPWRYLWFLPQKREYDRNLGYLNDFFKKMTQKYKKEYEQKKVNKCGYKSPNSDSQHNSEDEGVGIKPFRCMIEEMLCCGASDTEIFQEVGTILGTGHETTVVAMRMLMLHLALNPVHQAACREEVDKVINERCCKENTNSSCDETDCFKLTMEDLNDLKYLERCILESGRITSVVPGFVRRIGAPLKIDDSLEFPAGTNFAVCNWALHRDKNLYPDPLKFDPDRFLPENVKKRHPYSYTPFSLGPRVCIGWKVAIMQIKFIMAYMIHHFEIFSDDKLENVKLHFGVTIVPERDYRVTIRRREKPNL